MMNKINPIYILAFFVLVLIITIIQTNAIQREIVATTQLVSSIKQNGQEIASLKKHWKDSKQTLQRIEAILNQPPFKQKVVQKKRKANSYSLALHHLDAPLLDKFVSKMLNEYIIVKKITIERSSDTDISIAMEIAL